jgi:hypothetical protein
MTWPEVVARAECQPRRRAGHVHTSRQRRSKLLDAVDWILPQGTELVVVLVTLPCFRQCNRVPFLAREESEEVIWGPTPKPGSFPSNRWRSPGRESEQSGPSIACVNISLRSIPVPVQPHGMVPSFTQGQFRGSPSLAPGHVCASVTSASCTVGK